MILGSLICGFFFIDSYQDSFIYLGGQHGYYTTLLLKANIGWSGTLLVIIAGVLTFLISISSSTVPFLRKVFSLDIKASSKRKEEISSSDKNYVDEMSPNDNKNKNTEDILSNNDKEEDSYEYIAPEIDENQIENFNNDDTDKFEVVFNQHLNENNSDISQDNIPITEKGEEHTFTVEAGTEIIVSI